MKENQLVQLTISQSNDLIWMINPDLELIYANEAYLSLMKEVTGEEKRLNTSVFIEGFGEGYIEKWKGHYIKALKGEYLEVEEHFYHPAKKRIEYSQVALKPITDSDGDLIAVSCQARDITRLVKQCAEADQLMNASLDVFCTFNEQGEFVYVNEAATEHWGYTPEELLGTPYRSLVIEEDLDITDSVDASIKVGEEITSFRNRFRRKDGGISYNIWSSRWDERAKLFYSVARDGKDKIEQEKQLHQSEQRFKALVQGGNDLYAIIDTEGRYLYMSPSSTAIIGIPPEEFIGKDAFKFIHPDDLEDTLNSLKKIILEKTIVMKPYRAKNRKNEWRWVETVLTNRLDHPAVNGIVINSRDISSKIEEEHQLKLFKNVIDSTSDAIIITEAAPLDKPGPKIVYVNKAFTEITGYTAEEVLGRNPRFLQGPDSNKDELKLLGKRLRQGESSEITVLNYTKTGKEYWVNFTVNPVFDQKGVLTHFISLQRDVTSQKNKEQEQELIAQIGIDFARENNYVNATKQLCETIGEFGNFDWVELWNANLENTHLRLISHYLKEPSDELFYSHRENRDTFEYDKGLPGKVWASKEQVFWNAIEEQEDYLIEKAVEEIGLKSILGLPLMYQKEVVGVLLIGTKQKGNCPKQNTRSIENINEFIGAEIKRKKLENDLGHLYDTIPDIVCLTDFKGKFLKINEAGCKLLGYTEDEILQQTFDHFVHSEDQKIFTKEFQSLKAGQSTFKFENRYITKSGSVIWLSWYCNVSEGEEIVYATARNITEEKNLKELNKQTSRLAKIGSWEANLVTGNLFWSEEVHRLYETDPHTFVPSVDAAINFYREDFREMALSSFEECIKTGNSYELEAIVVNSNNKEFWVRTTAKAEFVDGSCVRVYGSFQDINERKQAEIGLRLSEAKFRTIFEIATLGIAQVDPANGRIILINSYYENITGYSREEMLKMNFLELIHPEDRKKDWEIFSKAAHGEEEYKNEKRYIKKDGTIVWVKVHLAFVRDEHGKPVRTVAICEDITEQKRAALQLEQSLKALEDYRFALDQSAIIAITDKKGVITSVNDNFCKISKYPKAELIGQTHQLINSKYHPAEFFTDLWKTIASGNVWRGEIKNKAKDDSYYWVDTTIVPFLDEKNRPFQYLAIRFDVTSRKEAEESVYSALIEKNDILESISDNFYALDDDFRFRYMNASCADLLQVDPIEIIGESVFKKYPNLLDTQFEQNLKFVQKTKEPVRFEFYFEPLDKWFQENVYPTPSGFSVYFQDITDKIEAEEKLKESNERFEKVTEATNDAIWDWNIANQTFYRSSAIERFFGKNVSKFLAQEDFWKDKFHSEDLINIQKSLNEAISDPLCTNWKSEYRIYNDEDKVIYVVDRGIIIRNDQGEAIRMIGTMADITERKNAEEEIKFKANLLSMVGQAAIATDLNGVVNYWNKAAETIYGWKEEEALGTHIMQLTTISPNEEADQIMELLRKGNSWSGEFTVQKKDGSKFEAMVTNSPIFDDNNKLSGIIGISSDITQEIKNKELLQKYTAELERSNEELEQFAFITSHDLQEPLRMITSFMDQLKRKYEDDLDEKALQYIHFATDGAKRMKQIILDLLDYSRANKPTEDIENVNLNQLVVDYKQSRRKLIAERSASVITEKLPELKTYRAAVTQIFHCLLDNAIKYARGETAPVVEINVLEKENEWEFTVRDNGIGIDPQFYDKIFVIFQRLHNRDTYDGTGIGLSIVKRSVEFLGGKIWLTSTLGEGSEFYFTIPKSEAV